MTGILLSLLVAFLKSLGEYAGKIFTSSKNKKNIDEYALAFGGRLMGALLTLPILFFIPFQHLSTSSFLILVLSAILNSIATVTALKSVKYGELSIVGPLSAFTIPFLIFSGYFIAGEVPNSQGIIGVLLIFIGTYFLGVSNNKKQGFFGPIKSLYSDLGAKYMLITAIIWSITGPLDKLGILEYGVFLWMFYVNMLIAFLMSVYFLCFRRKTFLQIQQISALKKISVMTILGAGTLLLQMFATKLTLVIYVISIKRASGIFSIFLGYFFFQEKNIGYKLLASMIMLLGVGIITIFGNI